MNHFEYHNGEMFAEAVPLKRIAREVGTPAYVYSLATLRRHYNVFDQAFAPVPHIVCFSVKANSNLALLRNFAKQGSGFDIVSGGELFRALKAGGDPKKIVFSGVGKKKHEIEYALNSGILMFNVESEEELTALERHRRRRRQESADQFARQSGRRSADPSVYFHRHEKSEVRRRYQDAPSTPTRERCRLRTSKSSASTAISARN